MKSVRKYLVLVLVLGSLLSVAWKQWEQPQLFKNDVQFDAGTVTVSSGVTFNVAGTRQISGTTVAVDAADLNGLTNVAASVSISTNASGSITNTITFQAVDSGGSSIVARSGFRFWFSATQYGAPSTNRINTATISSGVTIQAVTANADYWIQSLTNGSAAVQALATTGSTNWVQTLSPGGVISSAELVW